MAAIVTASAVWRLTASAALVWNLAGNQASPGVAGAMLRQVTAGISTSARRLAAGLCLSLTVWAAPAISGPIADSVTGFSSTQSLNNWSYGYYDGDSNAYTTGDFEQLPSYNTVSLPPGVAPCWTGAAQCSVVDAINDSLDAAGGATADPNVSNHSVVRRWVSPVTGEITISGYYQSRSDNAQAPLLRVRVAHPPYASDTLVWSASV
ncbi:MAG: hypothetical protein OEW72_00230, partial [Gammaproteobacteria bacterium]|nr:hypothetical protein [Gammaproteobacteria bacterium]